MIKSRQVVLSKKIGDVTGDGRRDTVYLVGTPTEGSQFTTNITLMIRNGRTGRVTQVPLPENAGYSPTVFLCDFTGDGVDDIKVTIQSGGSGGFTYTYVYSFLRSQLRLLFSGDQYMTSKQFRAYYEDGYVVVVVDEGLNLTFRIDVSTNPAAQELYDEDGNLLQPTEANVGPFIVAYPIVLDEASGTCSLQALTRVYGQFAADTLGYIQDYLSWNGTAFATIREDLAIQGATPEVQ
ncbi:MAG: FG-GAP-like repeat-containing protein [Bacillota bacterium]|nr:FG-GAP-like repeat-containing protein [Bacillota bacterium]